MNELELIQKAERGETLSQAEEARLDAMLSGQSSVQSVVREAAVDDTPSLQWRSELNQKLMAIQPAPAKKRFRFWPALPAVGAAAALAIFLVVPRTPSVTAPQTVAIEQEMINAHDQMLNSSDMNLAKSDAVTTGQKVDAEVLEWSQGNSDSL